MLTRGLVLSDRYRLDDRVAIGGMGAVWRCTDLMLERAVAVKALLPALSADPEFTARFRAEARMLAALRHPGVVAVHDVGRSVLDDGSQVDYLVMEYVDGQPLSSWLRRAGSLDPASTMSVVAQAADALHTAHLAGIVHRDVKPGNLLVKGDGRVVLVDFGIARSGTTAGITAANVMLGTASYMSPEQAANQPVSPATDVYALGAVAYFCLTGQPPFDGDNPLQVALRHLQEEPPPLPPGIPAAVAALVRRAMAKRPGDRFGDAAAMADAAAEARDATLAVVPTSARPPWAVAGPTSAAPSAARPDQGGTPAAGDAVAPAPAGPVAPPDPWAPLPPVAARPHPGPATGSDAWGPVPPTREDPVEPQPARRRRAALLGSAATGLVVLVGVAALALAPDDGPVGGDVPAALTGESAAAGPSGAAADDGTGRLRVEPTPGVTRATASSASRSPSASPPGRSPVPTAGSGEPTATAPGGPGPGPTTGQPAKPNPYTPVEACGSGYRVIDSAPLTASGSRKGRVYLLYHAGSGNNCVVTMKETAVGTATAASAWLEVRGRARSTDSGSFSYYAGPVRARAAGVCVKWGGSTGGASYGSGFEHCD
ncbi:protein kinase [Micromonospora sp. DSM 115977]|uniref:non-specific serine/threonine protein kinase n=1 Tax=Micromonospora reichwaldensis TaxID=3075516 RepID=A0ABU2WU00_9ACTN|nr:protein kinase [Micromonospora sp. DSM 115977]MDT0529367.1 protein kinase [Micromonospora sp. DSM 115977]